jgi:hypothetical protein
MKKLWLDDVRPPPDLSWTWINNAPAAYNAVLQLDIDEISFDHDLGDKFMTGYTIAQAIEERAYFGNIKRMKWSIHSANPVGRDNIHAAMNNADKFWDKHEGDNNGSR